MSLARLHPVNRSEPAILAQIKSLLTDILSVKEPFKVYLFGSAARDSMSGASDLDIAIILFSKEELKHFRSHFRRSQILFPIDINLFTKEEFERKKDEGGVCFDIEKEGIELFPQWRFFPWLQRCRAVPLTHDLEALIAQLPTGTLPPDHNVVGALTPFSLSKRYEEGEEIFSKEDVKAALILTRKFIEWGEQISQS